MNCETCGLTVCPAGCPNARPREAVFTCAECGENVLEGEGAFRIGEDVFCEFCVENMHFTA
ncbi:MAG: hypothetical protein LBK41_04635 [Clostridiales bacterium]|jgi:formylmethanofuran dehydrogenase subunit E|nr:hypothetical protein [Clostridiales bacterium]